jgi:hypothetical protein
MVNKINIQKVKNFNIKSNILNFNENNQNYRSYIDFSDYELDYRLTNSFNKKLKQFLNYFENEKILEIYIRHKLKYLGTQKKICFCKYCYVMRSILLDLNTYKNHCKLPDKKFIPK